MMHHKAPHRPWEPDGTHARAFADRWIPEPETFWDAYDTRTDALHENQQRVANDLTRPRSEAARRRPELAGAELRDVAGDEAGRRSTIDARRQDRHADRRGARALEVPALHAGLPRDRPVGGRQRRPAAGLPRSQADSRRTRSSSTRATRASSSATTACSTSGSCTRNRCACRSWSAGRPRSSRAPAATRWR